MGLGFRRWRRPDRNKNGDIVNGDITKTYSTPGIYDVSLTVTNEFGSDEITIPYIVTARVEAPDEATIEFAPLTSQSYDGTVIRSKTNEIISALVLTNGEQALDPIATYVWEFNDDLEHDDSDTAKALYSVGGIYDLKLKSETELGAYRITTFDKRSQLILLRNSIFGISFLILWHSLLLRRRLLMLTSSVC